MKYNELTFEMIASISEFTTFDTQIHKPGWYTFVGSSGGVLMEIKEDGTVRSAPSGFWPGDTDVETIFSVNPWA